jgi:hypothetical protein
MLLLQRLEQLQRLALDAGDPAPGTEHLPDDVGRDPAKHHPGMSQGANVWVMDVIEDSAIELAADQSRRYGEEAEAPGLQRLNPACDRFFIRGDPRREAQSERIAADLPRDCPGALGRAHA